MNARANDAQRRRPACTIDAVRKSAGAFAWQWHADDRTQRSSRPFHYFYDCVEDAQRHGFHVDLHLTVEQLRTMGFASPPQIVELA
jgi:hypothetical protein